MHHFEVEVLFLNPDNVPRAAEALGSHDCKLTIDPLLFDQDSSAAFGKVTGATALSEAAIGDWLLAIVGPLGGDVVQWRFR